MARDYGPFKPMRGARGTAEAIQLESSAGKDKADNKSLQKRDAVKRNDAALRRSRNMARTGISMGSGPRTPDTY